MSPNRQGLATMEPSRDGRELQAVQSGTMVVHRSVSEQLALVRAGRGYHDHAYVQCGVCARPTPQPRRCVECATMGHAACLNVHDMHGFDVCEHCVQYALQRYQRFVSDRQRRAWALSCQSIRDMRVEWTVRLAGAADAAGTMVAGAGVAAAATAATFARSVARTIREGVPEVTQGVLPGHPALPAPVVDGSLVPLPSSEDSQFSDALSALVDGHAVSRPTTRGRTTSRTSRSSRSSSRTQGLRRIASGASSAQSRTHSLSPAHVEGQPVDLLPRSAPTVRPPSRTWRSRLYSEPTLGRGVLPTAIRPPPALRQPEPDHSEAAEHRAAAAADRAAMPPPPAPLASPADGATSAGAEPARPLSRGMTGPRDRATLAAMGRCAVCDTGGASHRRHTYAPGCRKFTLFSGIRPPAETPVEASTQTEDAREHLSEQADWGYDCGCAEQIDELRTNFLNLEQRLDQMNECLAELVGRHHPGAGQPRAVPAYMFALPRQRSQKSQW